MVTKAIISFRPWKSLKKGQLIVSYGYCFHLNTDTNEVRTLDLTQVTPLGVSILNNKVGAGGTYFNTPSTSRMLIQGVSCGTFDMWQHVLQKSQWAVIQKEWRGAKHSCLASCVNLKEIKRRLELEANFSEIENPGRVNRLRVGSWLIEKGLDQGFQETHSIQIKL